MKALLHIQPSGLTVRVADAGDSLHYARDENGFDLFGRWLDCNRRAILYVCIDHPLIECHHERTPVLRGREKQSYLQILCERLSPDRQLITVQAKKEKGSGEQLLLVTTLIDDSSVVPWLEYLEERQALVAGVCFLPIALAGLKPLDQSRGHVLLAVADSFGGFRLSLYCGSVLLLNRHVAAADCLASQARRTLQFAIKNDLIRDASNGKVMLLSGEGVELLSTTDALFEGDGQWEFPADESVLTPKQIPNIINAMSRARGWMGRLANTRYRYMRLSQRLWAASVFFVLVGIAALIARTALMQQYSKLFEIADRQRVQVREQLSAVTIDGNSVESKISTVEFVTSIESDIARAPLHRLEWIANILQRQSAIQLLALQWQGSDHQSLVLVGLVGDEAFNLVDGVSKFGELLHAFQAFEGIGVNVSKAPFGLGTEAADTARVSGNLADRDFRIELSFADQWRADDQS